MTGTRAGSHKPLYQWTSEEYADSEQNWATIDAVIRIANELGTSPSQVALSWIANRPGVTAPIVGARTVKHLAENLGALDLILDDAKTAELEDVSASEIGRLPIRRIWSLATRKRSEGRPWGASASVCRWFGSSNRNGLNFQ